MAMASNLGVVCYDLEMVSRFFRSVGMAFALQKHTSIEWVEYRDSAVLNAVYTVMFWKGGPGFAEVRTGANAQIERSADEYHERFLLAWIEKLARGGPSAANEYVAEMGRLRERARLAVNEVFQDARQINAEVAGTAAEAIKRLSYVRLGAAVGVAVIGGVVGVAYAAAAAGGGVAAGGLTILGVPAGASAAQFGVAGLGASVAKTVVKTWEDAPKAKVAGIMTDSGKYAASEVGGKVAGDALEKAIAQQARSQQIMKSAEGMIRKQSERLAQESLKRKARDKATDILAKSQQQWAREGSNMTKAGSIAKTAGRVGMAIPVVFAAWDIMDAFTEHAETMNALR